MENSVESTFAARKPMLVVATVIFSFALIVVAFILSGRWYQIRGGANTITVTGSAQKVITSDVAKWRGSFYRSVGPSDIKVGTDQIKKDTQFVMSFLHDHNIDDSRITVDPLSISSNYVTDFDSRGNSSQVFSGYTITQSFTVESGDIASVGKAATDSGALIADGILFQTSNPEYYYTKLADLKIEMLNTATQDARNRAEKIAENSNSTLGKLRTASMGVTQITPENSSDISDYGYYDTSSIDKQVTVIVHSVFFVR